MIVFVALLLVNILVIFNIIIVKSTVLGAVFLVLYLVFNGYLTTPIFKQLIKVKEGAIRFLLGMFFVFSLFSFLGGAFIVFYRFNNLVISVILLATSLISFFLHQKLNNLLPDPASEVNFSSRKSVLGQITFQSYFTPVYIIIVLLLFIAFYILFTAVPVDEYIVSPWQVLPNQFVLVIILLSLLILSLIFFRPTKYLLIFIVLFSLLQHFYIPAVYRLPYGLDDWRHIGMMENLAAHGVIAPFNIIETLTSTNLSYASFWSGALFLKQTLDINLIPLTVWWHSIIFSLFLPVLLYVLVRLWGKDRAQKSAWALLAAFLPALFYPLQLYGGISLPVGFNFLFFLFFLISVIAWIKQPKASLRYFILGEFALMFFGYVIYWLIAGMILVFLAFYRRTSNYQQVLKQKVIRLIFLLASLAFIPVLGLWVSPNARFDILTTQMDYFSDFWRHNIQYFLGFKKIDSPRPQAGNLIWHDMRQNFVDLWPFNWQYFDTILLVLFLGLVFLGLRRLWQKTEFSMVKSLVLYLFFISGGSIFLDRYYFGGIHLLTERLDLILDLTLILIILTAVIYFIKQLKWRFQLPKIILILFFSLIIASTYISGPVYGRATPTQFKVMQLVYQDMEENSRQDYCVLYEHFPLAALEAISKGRVINGNFPMQYGYLERRGWLFVRMFSDPDINWLKGAVELSNTRGCYLVLDKRFLADWNKIQIRWLLGKEVLQVDDVYVWRYDGDNLKTQNSNVKTTT